jgi:fumarate hydratase subunit alpha
MRIINTDLIRGKVKELCLELAYKMSDDLKASLERGRSQECTYLGRQVLAMLLENGERAEEQQIPLCQDTGMVFVYLELGQDVHLEGPFVGDAVNQGVREAYEEGYLRKSMVDPITRANTKDNTPAQIQIEMVPGDGARLSVLLKGFGSENMGRVRMLTPSAGVEGIVDFVLDTVREAGGNPCPPLVVGIGIGGSMDKSAAMAKKALFRPLGERSPDPFLKELENRLLREINETHVGPMGFGGEITGLEVFIEKFPTHLAGLPVAVNLNCHSLRRKTIEL